MEPKHVVVRSWYIDLIIFSFIPQTLRNYSWKAELGCVVNYFTCCFHLYWKQPVTKYSLLSVYWSLLRCSLLWKRSWEQVVERWIKHKTVQAWESGKGLIPFIQGVTVVLSHRIVVSSSIFVPSLLISSSIPLCSLLVFDNDVKGSSIFLEYSFLDCNKPLEITSSKYRPS